MASTQIKRIGRKLEQLRDLDPQGSVLFGAAATAYRLNPPASPALLDAFESKHALSLPADFREFLLHIGNGGAGPYYGLYELRVEKFRWLPIRPRTNAIEVVPFSSAPEYTLRYRVNEDGDEEDANDDENASDENADDENADDEENARDSEADDAAFFAGLHERALRLCTQGCGMDALLIVDGPRRGQVWSWNSLAAAIMGFWPEMFVDVDEQVREARESDVECTYSSPATGGHPVTVYDIHPFGTTDDAEFFETLTEDGPLFLDWYEHWLDAGLRYFELNP